VRWLAAGEEGGNLTVTDLVSRVTTSIRDAHVGGAYSIVWDGDDLWSAGFDGTVKVWRNVAGTLRLDRTYRLGKSVLLLTVAERTWAASADDRTLVIRKKSGPEIVRVALDATIEGIAISPDEHYVAAVGLGQIVLIDLSRGRVASLDALGREHRCATFLRDNVLAVCGHAAIYDVDLESVIFTPYESGE